MRVTVLLFARLREIVGAAQLDWELGEGSSVDDLWRDLAIRYQGFDRYASSSAAAVNGAFARRETALADGDEVALLPPVSGGAS